MKLFLILFMMNSAIKANIEIFKIIDLRKINYGIDSNGRSKIRWECKSGMYVKTK